MSANPVTDLVSFYDTHPINEDEILVKAQAAGASLNSLTQDAIAPFDRDHYGGAQALEQLADAVGVTAGLRVLDVCSGMGGPARWLASTRGCHVTGIDLTLSRVDGAARLAARVGLSDRVTFVQGDATAMPLPDAAFDILMSQESWLHVPDKPKLMSECARVLKPGGTIGFTDIVRLGTLEAATEARLAAEIRTSNLATAAEYRQLLDANGCVVESEEDLTTVWRDNLVERLGMYRSLKDTTVAKFGEEHYDHYDRAYAHYVECFVDGRLGGVRLVATRQR